MKMPYQPALSSFFHSFSQIFLQRNALTGLMICIGIGLNSLELLFGGVVATIASLLCAKWFRCEEHLVSSGIYGYNAALVGVATFYFFNSGPLTIGIAILGGIFSAWLLNSMRVKLPRVPPLTASFVVTTWLILFIADLLGYAAPGPRPNPAPLGDFYAIVIGVGQVVFQGYWLTGLVFVFALGLSSFTVAFWAVAGSALGFATARALAFPEETILSGVYGFNACLAAIVLGKRYGRTLWPILIGIVLSTALTRVFELASLPALTAPFVAASWITISLVRGKKMQPGDKVEISP